MLNLTIEQLTDIKAAVRFYQQHHISLRSPRYLEYELLLDELDKALLNEDLPRHRRRSQIRRLNATGLIDGVTTNPTLIRKSGLHPDHVYSEIAELGIKDISMEVSGTVGEMYAEAQRLHEIFGDVATIKLPMTSDGLLVCNQISAQGIRTNVTLVFSIPQAILAAKAGATYVSPFVGRLDDQQVAGLEVVRGIAGLYAQKGVKTQVLAASIRNVHRAVRSFYNGASVVTMPPEVFEGMYKHILTDKGLEIFEQDVLSLKELFS